MNIFWYQQKVKSYIIEKPTSGKMHLENITNSRKDLVGKTQLCMTDHVSPSWGMRGRNSNSCFMPYILFRDSEKVTLQTINRMEKPSQVSRQQIKKQNLYTVVIFTALTCNFQHLWHHKMTKNPVAQGFSNPHPSEPKSRVRRHAFALG